MRLIFVRHPQTYCNFYDLAEGQLNSPYTDLGYFQSAYLVRALIKIESQFQEIVSSPLVRAKNIALIIANGLGKPLYIRDELSERHFGQWQGRISNQEIKKHQQFHDDFWSPPDGESRLAHRKRVWLLLEQIIKKNRDCLLICHAGTIVRAWEFLDIEKFTPDNASISLVEINHSSAKLLIKNDTSHLEDGQWILRQL